MRNSHAVLFDARPNYQYEKEHVPGALSLPYIEFAAFFKKYEKLKKDAIIIVYCDGNDCSASTRTSFKLIARGFRSIFNANGGLDEWNKKYRSLFVE